MGAIRQREFEQKKNNIIEAATQLFLKNGYSQTSVDEIIRHLKSSKGTFYHYFDNKLKLLDAVIETMVYSLKDGLAVNAEDSELSAVKKLNKYFSLPADFRDKNKSGMLRSFRVWRSDENVVFRSRLIKSLKKTSIPFIQKILEQGESENTMVVDNIAETSVLLFDLGVIMRDRIMENVLARKNSYANLNEIVTRYRSCVERMLCIPDNTLKIFDFEYFIKEK